ncbi:hypothetical protein [Xanthomarina gelatinilytica]|jgi:hypothetical protein
MNQIFSSNTGNHPEMPWKMVGKLFPTAYTNIYVTLIANKSLPNA